MLIANFTRSLPDLRVCKRATLQLAGCSVVTISPCYSCFKTDKITAFGSLILTMIAVSKQNSHTNRSNDNGNR